MLDYGEVQTKNVSCPICKVAVPEGNKKIVVLDFLNRLRNQDFYYTLCNCGVYYLINQPLELDIKKIYSLEYEAYNLKTGIVAELKKVRMKKVIKPYLIKSRKTKILDYGCGSGQFLHSTLGLVDTLPIGFDINPPNNMAETKILFTKEHIDLFLNAPFDLILAFQVIEHVPDPYEFLVLLKRILSKDGTIIIETPSPTGILFNRFIRKFWGGWHAPRHFVIFDEITLRNLCSRAGFSVEKLSYIPSPFQWIETIRPFINKNSKINKYLSLDNFFLVTIFYCIDAVQIFFGLKTSNMKFVLKNYPITL